MIKFKNVSEIKSLENFTNFQICSDGKLMNIKTQKFLKGNHSGAYLKYTLSQNGKTRTIEAHRLVALAFVDNYFDGAVVDHIDHNVSNNNHTNLRWITFKQNNQHKNYPSKKKKHYIIAINKDTKEEKLFSSITECANKLSISINGIFKCLKKTRKSTGGYKLYFVEQ